LILAVIHGGYLPYTKVQLILKNEVEGAPMQSGDHKNWVRLCDTIDGFRAEHGRWPTKILLPEAIFHTLKQDAFSKERLEMIEENLSFVVEDVAIVAADDNGRYYSYGDLGFPQNRPEIAAQECLDVLINQPDEM